MKSIIIIIAIFLVTLTAKADWVKSGELDSLYLGDAPITFSKYSPDYTKFVTYSAQDSTLRLWDLVTGKVIKERKLLLDIGYAKFEFDFLNERLFYFKIRLYMETGDQYLRYINFENEEQSILVTKGFVDTRSAPIVYGLKCFFKNLSLIDSEIQIIFNLEDFRADTQGTTSKNSVQYFNIEFTKDSFTKKQKGIKQTYAWFIFNNGFLIYTDLKDEIYLKFSDTLTLQNFKYSVYNKKYPSLNSSFKPFDINFDYLIFQDSNYELQFYSKNYKLINNYNVPLNSKIIRNFKLISSPKYSVFYQDTNRLTLCDNQSKKLIDTINLPEGNIGYSDSTKYAYSFVSKTVYRNRFNKDIGEYDDIFTDNLFYKTTDSIILMKNINPMDSNLIWKVNGNLYYGNKPKLQIVKTGFYKVELAFERNGKKYTIQKDSLIKVVDSLVYSDLILPSAIEVVKPKGWNYKYPFKFKSSWKIAKIDTFKWYINDSLISTNKEFEYKFQFCNSYRVSLVLSSIYFDRVFSQEVVALQDFQYSFSNTIGEKPLKMAINYKHFATYDTLYNGYKAQYGSSILIFYQYINGKLERVADNYHSKNNEGSDTIVFNTVGTYLVRQENYLFFNDWITYKPNEMDTAVIVLAPSDIQDFAEKKYIFKQDADGIYCQLEGEGEVALYDNVGRLVRTYQIENERYIRKEDLERGVYFLSIQTGENVYHEKVLVE